MIALATLLALGAALGIPLDGRPGPERPTLRAARVEPGAVRVDGRFDEAVWATAPVAAGFVMRQPDPGATPSEQTEARVAVDGDAVYVAMRMMDSQPDAIDARLGRRDSYLESDWATVGIGSLADGRTAYQFAVNPAGVQRDALLYDDVRQDPSWDAVWDVAVARGAGGWTAEFRIPLSQLRFDPDDDTWGVQFGRVLQRTNESAYWAPWSPEDQGTVSVYGSLEGVGGLKASRRLEVLPYVASRLGRAPGDAKDPFYSETDLDPRIGADVKVGVTGDLTLSATVNPDFGQVEADPAQVNLSQFELFLAERRPFFQEGTDAFSFGRVGYSDIVGAVDFLYTRRIGRSPQRTGFVPGEAYAAGEVYTDAPGQTTILGAAKLSGRVGRFTVGVLDAVTAPERGRFAAVGPDGRATLDGDALVEPLSNYLAARARGTFGATTVGGLVTSTVRDGRDPAIAGLLPTHATVAGLDLEHRFGGQWAFGAVASASLSGGEPDAIARLQRSSARYYDRPDADHLSFDPARSALGGLAGGIMLAKQGGATTGQLKLYGVSPGFDANALGYQTRADEVHAFANVSHAWNQPSGPFQQRNLSGFVLAEGNTAGDLTQVVFGLNSSARFRVGSDQWSAGMNVNLVPRTVSDRLTRGGPLAGSAAVAGANLYAYTDERRVVSGSVFTYGQADEIGGMYLSGGASLGVRPSPSVSVSAGPNVTVRTSQDQYVTALDAPQAATFGRRYVFAQLNQTTMSLNARLDWTFTPDLTLQLYARPFLTAGDYGRFRELASPGTLDFPVYGEDRGSIARLDDGSFEVDPGDGGDPFAVRDPSFTFRSLQGNAVLRWEYRPGSTLFLVWQQQRDGFEASVDRGLGRNVDLLLDAPPSNVFLLKLSYWLG